MKCKSTNYIFIGPLAEYCIQYVNYKQSLGFKIGNSYYYLLRGMDNYFLENGLQLNSSILTKEMVEKYVARRGQESTKTQYMRMSVIRQFSLFMNRLGLDYYVYPQIELVKINSDFVPYILTYDEVVRLIKVLDEIPYTSNTPRHHIIYPMLFRMLYGCGLRVNEALGLKMKDVNLQEGTIKLNNTKNDIQRLIPMSQSLMNYSKQYVKNMRFDSSYDGYFYPNRNGGEYTSTPVYCQFRKFMTKAGIFRENGTTPRVHDFRHTFAIHALEKMVADGKDIYCSLPILSTYLGHRGIESTEKYLRLTSEFHNSVIDKMNDYYGNPCTEVIDDED